MTTRSRQRRHLGLLIASAAIASSSIGACTDLDNLSNPSDAADSAAPLDAVASSDTGTSSPTDSAAVDTGVITPADDGSTDAGDGASMSDAGVDAADAAPLGCNGNPNCNRVVFLSSTSYMASMGNLAGADARCQALADMVDAAPKVKGRTFKAWLSIGATPAAGRLVHGIGDYRRPDDVLIAANWSDLTDGTIVSPIVIDDKGNTRPNSIVWTGTDEAGASTGANWCSNWNVAGAGVAWTGLASSVVATWTNNSGQSCASPNAYHIYCFEY